MQHPLFETTDEHQRIYSNTTESNACFFKYIPPVSLGTVTVPQLIQNNKQLSPRPPLNKHL